MTTVIYCVLYLIVINSMRTIALGFHCKIQGTSTTMCEGEGQTYQPLEFVPLVAKQTESLELCNYGILNMSRATFKNIKGIPLKELHFYDTVINIVSEDTFSSFQLRKLVFVNIRNVNLTALGVAFGSVKNASGLTAENININETVLEFLFSNMNVGMIENLNLARNLIASVKLEMFQNWHALKTLDLRHNRIGTITAPSSPLNSLETLMLSISSFKNEAIDICGSSSDDKRLYPILQTLEITDGSLNQLENRLWNCMLSLKYLNLSKNRVTDLNFTEIVGQEKLTHLDLSNNYISTSTNISDMDVNKPLSLENIILSGNQFSVFPPWFCTKDIQIKLFPNLRHIDLSDNLVKIPWSDAWHCLNRLTCLNLSGNMLQEIRNNTFADLLKLEELDLSRTFGKLQSVELLAFNNSNLKRLQFAYNFFNFSEHSRSNLTNIFKHLPNLTELDISYNFVNNGFGSLLSTLKKLQKLNLKKTDISFVPQEIPTNLVTLILDDNGIEFASDSKINAENLKYMSLKNNKISAVNATAFSEATLKSLLELNLAQNPFDCDCDIVWFLEFAQKDHKEKYNITLLEWPNEYICASPKNMKGNFVNMFDERDVCDRISPFLIAYISCGSLMFVVIVVSIILYRWRWYIRFWAYRIKRVKLQNSRNSEEQPLLKDKYQYDAYCIYDTEDDEACKFIKWHFQKFLENSFNYLIHFWHRNAGCGPWITEFGEGMYGSKYVVAVISNSFLRDSWCKFQLEMAMERERVVRNKLKRNVLLLVVTEGINLDLLNKYWCVVLTKSTTVYWCSDKSSTQWKVLEERFKQFLGEPIGNI